MLVVLPSDPATDQASMLLTQLGIAHEVIVIPMSLNYKTGAERAIYSQDARKGEIATILTKHRLVVMRVFKAYVHSNEDASDDII